jgi:hypothetical protein
VRVASASPTGDSMQIEWDATSCPAGGYNLLYGDLADVATASLSGSACGIGTDGSFLWGAVPAGDLFFLVVGTDGGAVESSWGESVLGERHGLTPSDQCGVTLKDISNVCE